MASTGARSEVGEAPLYTGAFAFACLVHWTAAMSLSLWVLQPLFLRRLGASDATIGLALGLGAAASVATRPFVGRLLDRAGRRAVLIGAGALNVVTWLAFLWIERLGPWVFVWTVLHHLAWGGLFAGLFTYAADLTPPARRAEGLAIFGVFGMAANGFGPVFGETLIDRAGFAGFFATAAIFGAASVLLTAFLPRHAPVAALGSRETTPLLAAGRAPGIPRVLVATVLLGIAINAAWYFVAPFTRDLGLERAGPFFAAYSVASVVVRLFGRRSLDVLGPHRVSTPAFLAFAAGLAGLVLLPMPGVLILTGVGCGIGHGTLFPVLSALAVSRAPAGQQGAVVSLHTAALDLGAVVGTPICGALADAFGWRVMFAVSSVACLAGLVLVARDPRRPRA